jgi:hypothetical protein
VRISREGTNNNYRGEFYIDLTNPTIQWDNRANVLMLRAHRVRDFGCGESTIYHNYRVAISLSEFMTQLRVVSKAPQGSDAAVVSASLSSSLPDLLRLALACLGDGPTQE